MNDIKYNVHGNQVIGLYWRLWASIQFIDIGKDATEYNPYPYIIFLN